MNKTESLKKLLETIEGNEKLAHGVYCKGESNCVIGHLLKSGGVSQEQLKKIDAGVYGHNYAIISILKNGKVYLVNDALEALGFDINSDSDIRLLNDLQEINDNDGIEAVIKHLIETIKTLEEK